MLQPQPPASSVYAELAARAVAASGGRRDVAGLSQVNVVRGRLFAYAYRNQTIGTFHATAEALSPWIADPAVARARARLRDLQTLAMRPVPTDFRAVAPVLGSYHAWCDEVVDTLAAASAPEAVRPIVERFAATIGRIRASDGIVPGRDDELPPQASYQVPGIDVVIVPLVYGDHISWNTAYLTAGSAGATTHRHAHQVEIHLGHADARGRTLLDGRCAAVAGAYAMPIPPMLDHGFDNLSGHDHFVPFIFGSRSLDGWGVFFDVEPRPSDTATWPNVALEAPEMRGSMYLAPAIRRLRRGPAGRRNVLISAARTARPETGGLELAAYHLRDAPCLLGAPQFRIVSVYAGSAWLDLGGARVQLTAHDHVGLPEGVPATVEARGDGGAVLLEASLQPL